METVKVSLILPVYNVEKYLSRCLDSLLRQTLKEIEIICVHDGSKDGCLKILQTYAEAHKQIVVIDKENEGTYRARIDGIKIAKGEYIGFVDPDDYVAEDFAEKLYQKAKESDGDIVCCGFQRIDGSSGKPYSTEMNQYGKRMIHMDQNPDASVSVNTALWNKIFKAEVLQDWKCFETMNPVILEDCCFMMLVYRKVKTIFFLDDVLYFYMVRQDGTSQSIDKRLLKEAECSMLQVKEIYQKTAEEKMVEIVDLMAFLHLGINMMYLISSKDSVFHETLKKNRLLLDLKFPLWKTSRYLKISYTLRHGFNRRIAVLRMIYRWHFLRIFLVAYRWMIHTLHKDIKW